PPRQRRTRRRPRPTRPRTRRTRPPTRPRTPPRKRPRLPRTPPTQPRTPPPRPLTRPRTQRTRARPPPTRPCKTPRTPRRSSDRGSGRGTAAANSLRPFCFARSRCRVERDGEPLLRRRVPRDPPRQRLPLLPVLLGARARQVEDAGAVAGAIDIHLRDAQLRDDREAGRFHELVEVRARMRARVDAHADEAGGKIALLHRLVLRDLRQEARGRRAVDDAPCRRLAFLRVLRVVGAHHLGKQRGTA